MPPASGHRCRRSASSSSTRCAAVRCRRRRTRRLRATRRAAPPDRHRRSRRTCRARAGPSSCRAASAMRSAAVAVRRARAEDDPPAIVDPPASPVTSVANAPSGQRRNGLPALTWVTSARADGRRRHRAAARRCAHPRRWSSGISTGSRAGSGVISGHPSSAASRSHWLTTECRGCRSRGRCTVRVYSSAAPGSRSQFARGAGRPGQPRAPRAAVEIDARRRTVRARSRRARSRSSRTRGHPRVRGRRAPRRCGGCQLRPERRRVSTR